MFTLLKTDTTKSRSRSSDQISIKFAFENILMKTSWTCEEKKSILYNRDLKGTWGPKYE